MPTPTSFRKKSLMPSNELRRRLRATGHALDPVVQLGKLGATDSVIKQIAQALADHELIKVKLGTECPETRFEVAETFASIPNVNVVQILGRTILLYKRHPKKPRFEKAEGSERAEKANKTKKAAPAKRAKKSR